MSCFPVAVSHDIMLWVSFGQGAACSVFVLHALVQTWLCCLWLSQVSGQGTEWRSERRKLLDGSRRLLQTNDVLLQRNADLMQALADASAKRDNA